MENGSATTHRGEYTLDEFKAAVSAVAERFADPFVTATDEWFRDGDRAHVRARLLGQIGPARTADMAVGVAIGLQMAEARRADR